MMIESTLPPFPETLLDRAIGVIYLYISSTAIEHYPITYPVLSDPITDRTEILLY